MMFYTVEGSIEDPENIEIECKDIYLKHIGSATFTEFDAEGDDINMYMEKPERRKWRAGAIHSHHNMKLGFSGTDYEDLAENSTGVDYYLSMIVNSQSYNGWFSKIAMKGIKKVTTERTFVGNIKKILKMDTTEEVDVLYILTPTIEVLAEGALGEIAENLVGVRTKMRKSVPARNKVIGFTPDKINNENFTNFQNFVDSHEQEEVIDTQDEAYLQACIFMGLQGIENGLSSCVTKMSHHLKPIDFGGFATSKVKTAEGVINEFFNDTTSPIFILEVIDDFLQALRLVHAGYRKNSLEDMLCEKMENAFEATFYGLDNSQLDLRLTEDL